MNDEVQRQHVMKRSRAVSGWSLNAPMLYHKSVLRERFQDHLYLFDREINLNSVL